METAIVAGASSFVTLVANTWNTSQKNIVDVEKKLLTTRTELKDEFRHSLQNVKVELQTEFRHSLQNVKEELQTEFRHSLQNVKEELQTEIRNGQKHSWKKELQAEIRDGQKELHDGQQILKKELMNSIRDLITLLVEKRRWFVDEALRVWQLRCCVAPLV